VCPSPSADLHIVLFPAHALPVAKQFWQHSGTGISSRLAEYCLSILSGEIESSRAPSPVVSRFASKNKHYSVNGSAKRSSVDGKSRPAQIFGNLEDEVLSKDQNLYLEERYGRNLSLSSAPSAKRALRRRIAGVLASDCPEQCPSGSLAGEDEAGIGPSSRGISDVSENDVFLFPTGMSAIWNAHQLALAVRPVAKSVCFGYAVVFLSAALGPHDAPLRFPYTDTLKVLEKWGPGCHFLGHGLDTDIDELEMIIKEESSLPRCDPSNPPILGLFTEFPSNPLLRSANLPRLRALADKHDFLIVVDETLGNFVNVEVLRYADIVVSSLSKIFSGESNVMGGRYEYVYGKGVDAEFISYHSLVLNPKGRHYEALKAHMAFSYEDVYFNEDAIYMERNSRNFRQRIKVIDANADAVCSFLRARSAAGGSTAPVIKDVFYPKWQTRSHYEHCRISGGGFGGLFSLTFTSPSASRAFFDALPCYKGPSLGTNFTLASPYTILAHYTEMEWAAEYGVEETLVRVSVGMEETGALIQSFEKALKAAEVALASRYRGGKIII
jgi:cystathionine gamma-synthase